MGTTVQSLTVLMVQRAVSWVTLEVFEGTASAEALRVRDTFRRYFNSPAGQVPWQVSHVNRGLPQ